MFEGRKKINFYIMFLIKPEIWVWEAKPVEVVKDGHVKKLTEGRMKIVINGGYITDYDGDFEKGNGLKKIESFLNNKVLYHEIFLKYFDYLDYFLHNYMTDIKKYLEMDSATNAY